MGNWLSDFEQIPDVSKQEDEEINRMADESEESGLPPPPKRSSKPVTHDDFDDDIPF